jgi:hypothetical protein
VDITAHTLRWRRGISAALSEPKVENVVCIPSSHAQIKVYIMVWNLRRTYEIPIPSSQFRVDAMVSTLSGARDLGGKNNGIRLEFRQQCRNSAASTYTERHGAHYLTMHLNPRYAS